MSKVYSIETALAFLSLCEGEDSEFDEAVKLVRERIVADSLTIIDLRKDMRTQVETLVADHRIRLEQRIAELEDKLDVERDKLLAIRNVIYGKDNWP